MKNITILFLIGVSVCTLSLPLGAQTRIPLTDNMVIQSNSNIRLLPGSYHFGDAAKDGVIRIVNQENITIDGDSVEVTGNGFEGFMIYIESSRNITIRNFKSVSSFYYAATAHHSSDIHIENNNFSYNKKDTSGWIHIWGEAEEALGGGVLLRHCEKSSLSGNTMIQQNDGIALYNCGKITMEDNILHWNCGFGIRMNFADSCYVRRNDCSHVNRLTDPSDCAAILLIASKYDTIEHNNFTYSGDGVFLSQQNYTQIPACNYFAFNDCSFSPHNAIECTFSDVNTFKGNICNYSHYGFWLGYSSRTTVDQNEIIGNLQSGIAVNKGYQNTFTGNTIKENPLGVELWEGDRIAPYEEQDSRDYWITGNLLEGNTKAISSIVTEHLVVKDNTFNRNKEDIYLEDKPVHDTITGNTFKSTTLYTIHSTSTEGIYAPYNTYIPMIDSLIHNRITGNVTWLPYNRTDEPMIQETPPCDMAEQPGIWTIYADAGYGNRATETLEYDYSVRKVGASSIKMYTPRGWDVGLNYRPGSDSLALWSLSENDTLSFYVRTLNPSSYGFQGFTIRVGNVNQGYYQFTGQASLLNSAKNTWKRYRVPLRGNSSFPRTTVGNMSLSNVNYVEFRADTWDYGYTIWFDGVQFKACTPTGIDDTPAVAALNSGCYPNPSSSTVNIWFDLPGNDHVRLSIFDLSGRCLTSLLDAEMPAGRHETTFSSQSIAPGIYFYRLQTSSKVMTGKLIRNGD